MRLAVFPLQEHDRFRPLAALGLDLPEDLDGGAKRDRKPRLLIERAQLELRRRVRGLGSENGPSVTFERR